MTRKPFKSAKEIENALNKRGDYGYSADPLSLQIMAFIAIQLEAMNSTKAKKRPMSAWNKFFAAQIRAGRSAKQAAEAWKSRQSKKA